MPVIWSNETTKKWGKAMHDQPMSLGLKLLTGFVFTCLLGFLFLGEPIRDLNAKPIKVETHFVPVPATPPGPKF
jgi:hypothetical protein